MPLRKAEIAAAWIPGKHIVIRLDLVDRLPVDLAGVQTLTIDEMSQPEDIIQTAA